MQEKVILLTIYFIFYLFVFVYLLFILGLSDYSIVSDRNNLRKMDAALKGETDYSNFDIYLQKINNTLFLKREDIGGPITMAG